MSDKPRTPLRVALLMPKPHAEASLHYGLSAGVSLQGQCVETLGELQAVVAAGCDLILAFCTSVIVPEDILAVPGLKAVNVHGALPEFPGRDPHHFAHYAQVSEYGATMHYMDSTVDSGPIIDVEVFRVTPEMTPAVLLGHATAAGMVLIQRFMHGLASGNWPVPSPTLKWGRRKTTRKDFIELCRVDTSIGCDEFERRRAATSMPGYSNLFIELHGYRFRLEGKVE